MMPGRTLQIRMTPELTARLDAVATGLNIRPATLGRAALVAWLDSIEQDGIQLHIPHYAYKAIPGSTEIGQ